MSSNFSKRTRFAMQTGALDQRTDLIDDRPLTSLIFDYMPMLISGLFIFVGVITIMFPAISLFIFLLGLPLYLYGTSVQMDYLVSAPYAKDKVKHDQKSRKNSKKYNGENAKSGFFLKHGDAFMLLGYDLLFGRQIWINVDRETRMGLIAGTTGSGKTVTLNSKLYQSCIQGHLKHGAPVLLADGKGSVNGLYDFLFYIVRAGRIHDVRIMNFLTGGAEHNPESMLDEDYPSNKFNIFSSTNSEESRGIIIGMGQTGEGGSNDYFRDRASNMIAGAFPPLIYARDKLGEPLDITVLQQNLGLREMIKLASRQDIPKTVTQPLREYLKTLNMINDAYFTSPDADIEINQKADEQHTYNKSMVTKAVNEMAGTFGHIFSSVGSDINVRNVIMHGQILLTLLPTIEKEPDSMAELGRLFIGSMRPAFASMFGYKIQGLRKSVIDGLAINRIVPVRVFLDEVLNYYQRGLSQFLSLMRDRKVSMYLLGQSMKGMEDAGLSEARQSKANLNNKIIFSSQDFYETFDLLQKTLGTFRVKRLAEKTQSVWGGWINGERLQESEENILAERDIASADPMEGIYMYRGKALPFRSATFFPDNERDGELGQFYLNHFAELEYPTQQHIELTRAILGLESAVKNNELNGVDPSANPNIITADFVNKVETICSSIAQADKTDVYSSFDAIVFAMLDDMVQKDIAKVNAAQAQLLSDADKERDERNASRSVDEVLQSSTDSTVLVDAETVFNSHSEFYSDQLGINPYGVPDYSDDEDDDDVCDSAQALDEYANFADAERNDSLPDDAHDNSGASEVPKSTPSGVGWFDKSALSQMQSSTPSYGEVMGEEITDPSTNESTNQEEHNSTGSPLNNAHSHAVAKEIASAADLSVEAVTEELLEVEVYTTQPTPPLLPESEHPALTRNVAHDLSASDERHKAEAEAKHGEILDNFLGG
ncbi:conserved hypothetical protein [Vibrio nigripulchritudo SOn1]|uniref:TraD/TraG TraM recognition site domain-containing protein n=1 Tax=Vibrio nigripulchritudo SOn1 TaxID=1238450 RepID=A0AAV2VQ35_9VIBR|nr:helicase HerA-like domain-containing protein [Vibrio nigripulchritudo]CCO46791.1 conserved hypothetical protein [Vibrio nigripulchritudo SOn1]